MSTTPEITPEQPADAGCVRRLVRLGVDHRYITSRDYALLFEMAQSQSVVCMLDYYECRDIAATMAYGGTTEIGSRGVGYVWARTEEEFVAQCERLNVEFILPNNESRDAGRRSL